MRKSKCNYSGFYWIVPGMLLLTCILFPFNAFANNEIDEIRQQLKTMAETMKVLQEKLEKQDRDSFGTDVGRVTDPNEHFFQDFLDGIFFLLGVMGSLALILGLLLVYNTINAVISQQVDQIGIMKAIGAKTGQILGIYLAAILVYGFLALLIARFPRPRVPRRARRAVGPVSAEKRIASAPGHPPRSV